MREFFKNYKVWLVTSLTLLVMIVAICISFSSNYHELEDFRTTDYENSEQKVMITELREENNELKTTNDSLNHTDEIEMIMREYVKIFYNTDGTESENEKAIKIRKYVTDTVYEQMFDENEAPVAETGEKITQSALVEKIVYQATDNKQAVGDATIKVTYIFPDDEKETKEILLQMEFQYDEEKSVWKISSVSSSNIKIRKVWG